MIDSILEIRSGGLPFPHGTPNKEWRYRHAVRPEGPTALDRQIVADFIAYENAHERVVSVVSDPALEEWRIWQAPSTRPSPVDYAVQCCSDVYPQGCTSRLVCHGAPSMALEQILSDGALLSAATRIGRVGEELADASTWGEPPDYFEHVMLANGRCTAPEAVALSRVLGRDLVPGDLQASYPHAVRLYFDWSTLVGHADARFDGVHPIKIHGRLSLADYLVAMVIDARDPHLVDLGRSSKYRDRLVEVEVFDPSASSWSSAACTAAEHI